MPILDRIFLELQKIRFRLDDLEVRLAGWDIVLPLKSPASELMLLPDHLRKTYLAVASAGECSATEASNATGRCRAVESAYLNQLVRMCWLIRHRESKALKFRLKARIQISVAEPTTMYSSPGDEL